MEETTRVCLREWRYLVRAREHFCLKIFTGCRKQLPIKCLKKKTERPEVGWTYKQQLRKYTMPKIIYIYIYIYKDFIQ